MTPDDDDSEKKEICTRVVCCFYYLHIDDMDGQISTGDMIRELQILCFTLARPKIEMKSQMGCDVRCERSCSVCQLFHTEIAIAASVPYTCNAIKLLLFDCLVVFVCWIVVALVVNVEREAVRRYETDTNW